MDNYKIIRIDDIFIKISNDDIYGDGLYYIVNINRKFSINRKKYKRLRIYKNIKEVID